MGGNSNDFKLDTKFWYKLNDTVTLAIPKIILSSIYEGNFYGTTIL